MKKNKKDILIKTSVELSRIILGVTFIFSGFLKSVDPLGTAYKIQDYLTAMHLSWLHLTALPASFVLCSLEFLLGVWMLFGIYRRIVTKLLLIVMVFMTALTLYLALANPVQDCGCFGDAFTITNWQTFYKNIVLLVCAVIVFIWHFRVQPLYSRHTYWLAALFSVGFIICFNIYNYIFLPVFDFRPYKEGVDLKKQVAQKSKGDVYENTFVYEKDGVKQTFTEQNYPWKDPSWKFVEMKQKLIKEGEKSGVEDFAVNQFTLSPDKKKIIGENDITHDILNDSTYTFLMIAYSLNNMSESHLGEFEDLSYYAQEHGYKFYCLTASPAEDILRYIDNSGVNYSFCSTDERVLKTMIRSNPGLILMKNGQIIRKWPDISVPSEKVLNAPLEKLSFVKVIDRNEKNKDKMLILCIIFVSPLVVLQMLDLVVYKRPVRKRLKIKAVEEETLKKEQ